MLECCDAVEMEMLKMLDDGMRGRGIEDWKSEDRHLYLEHLPKMKPK
jgi:hypothetical protein